MDDLLLPSMEKRVDVIKQAFIDKDIAVTEEDDKAFFNIAKVIPEKWTNAEVLCKMIPISGLQIVDEPIKEYKDQKFDDLRGYEKLFVNLLVAQVLCQQV